MGYCARRQTLPWLVGGAVLATLTLYLCGTLWLTTYTGQHFGTAVMLGAAPFVFGDALKCAAAVMAIRLARSRMPRML